jgi:hypothetical protein
VLAPRLSLNRTGIVTPVDCVQPSPSVREYNLDEGSLLLNKANSCVVAVNKPASELWQAALSGANRQDLERALSQKWGIDTSVAQKDVQSLLSNWRILGLLAKGELQGSAPPADDAIDTSANEENWSAEWICSIAGKNIAYACEKEPVVSLREFLQPLISHTSPGGIANARIELRTFANGVMTVRSRGAERVKTSRVELVLGAIWQTTLEILHDRYTWLALIHGSAVAHNGRAIALCGPSGSGKTTLAAGLIAVGFDYFCDDLVPLTPEGTVLPWPLPLNVKPGSFDVLSPYHPGLLRAPMLSTKGVQARLLTVPQERWSAAPVLLSALVFSRFCPGATSVIKKSPALTQLSGFWLIVCGLVIQ